jgi:hypothetical protein
MRYQKLKLGIIFAGAAMCASAQWLNYPTPGTPRTNDGKPNLSAPAPRLSNAKPDLSGVWQIESPAPGEMERKVGDVSTFVVPGDDPRTFSPYFFNILADFKPPFGRKPPQCLRRMRGVLAMTAPAATVCPWASPVQN